MPGKVPTHLAIIMDGNGRWAQSRGYHRTRGHREGAKRVDEIVTACTELGISYLTLYAFSTENWLRPGTEVSVLMRLLVHHLKTMDKKLIKNRVVLSASGALHRLPAVVRKELDRVIAQTQTDEPALHLNLALSYGGRQEIVDATRQIANEVKLGKVQLDEITEELFKKHLYQPTFPDPDLLIRTGGESRISNFLLWEIAYSEFLVVEEFWPDFRPKNLEKALESFGNRKRRFGMTQEQVEKKSLFSRIKKKTEDLQRGRDS